MANTQPRSASNVLTLTAASKCCGWKTTSKKHSCRYYTHGYAQPGKRTLSSCFRNKNWWSQKIAMHAHQSLWVEAFYPRATAYWRNGDSLLTLTETWHSTPVSRTHSYPPKGINPHTDPMLRAGSCMAGLHWSIRCIWPWCRGCCIGRKLIMPTHVFFVPMAERDQGIPPNKRKPIWHHHQLRSGDGRNPHIVARHGESVPPPERKARRTLQQQHTHC